MAFPLTEEYVLRAISEAGFDFHCHETHPGVGCNEMAVKMILREYRTVIRTYLPVHIVPFLLFKRKQFLKAPLWELLKLIVGILRSVLFGVGYYCSYKRWSCLLFSDCKYNNREVMVCTALGGLPILFETRGRQAEIALFTVYKNMHLVYNMARRRGLPVRMPAGNCLITAFALCVICYHYFNSREVIKESYANLIDKLLQDS